MSIAIAQTRRDLAIVVRSRGEALNPLAFFALATLLFGLAGPSPETRAAIAPGAVWALAALATTLSMEGLFRRDVEEGALEQLLLHARPLWPAVLGKLFAHWCVTGLPLVVLGPVAALALQASTDVLPALALGLLLGTPTLTLIGAIAAALTAGIGRGSLLVALIALPLCVPTLIFGAGAAFAAAAGADPTPQLLWLAALLAAAATAAPFAVGAGLRVSQEY